MKVSTIGREISNLKAHGIAAIQLPKAEKRQKEIQHLPTLSAPKGLGCKEPRHKSPFSQVH